MRLPSVVLAATAADMSSADDAVLRELTELFATLRNHTLTDTDTQLTATVRALLKTLKALIRPTTADAADRDLG